MAQTEPTFEPQDFSRFLIREFLKVNKMEQTYASFMAEDSREKVVMSKNKLTNLLGLEFLVKRNSKSKAKPFQTMLDIISNYLAEVKEIEGVVKVPEKKSSPAGKASAYAADPIISHSVATNFSANTQTTASSYGGNANHRASSSSK